MTDSSTTDSLWCRRFHPADDAPARLVCFPHAGGSASYFLPVSAALSPAVDVLAVQYPGRQDRRAEPCIEDIGTLADEAFRALVAWADRPLTFFGHSMGAIMAFEVARRFAREGMDAPVHLFASGRRAPSVHRDENVHQRGDDEILAEMVSLGGTDARLLADEELVRMVLPSIRADYKAVERYRCEPGAVLSCPVTALTGDADPRTSIEDARAWAAHTTAGFELRVFEGGHFFLTSRATEVIEALREHFATTPAQSH
ncbi:thioesterase II family protein [Streptomyces sp. NK08204]|uniref:thioesterase II family protein n=1 Tax=Streptomyces sp. NK08204 TaxID=2873260 RepID=UPI001CED92FF|nr:alpha/beta fold hydrolase [Streptomyces sp. NK08204]